VLAIHGVGLMALLMQGCKKEPDAGSSTVATAESTNTPAPAFVEPTNTPAADTNLATTTATNVPPAPVETAPAAAPASDYVIAKGDTFSTVAKKFHLSVKALMEANPSVEPTKLKIGQPLHIPAVLAASPSATTTTTTGDASSAGQTYTVKSGDSLTKIAGQFGISVKALRSANSLKTDKIVVGQKLAIPAKSSAQPTVVTSAPPANSTGQ
jgi:LysM repeat protein